MELTDGQKIYIWKYLEEADTTIDFWNDLVDNSCIEIYYNDNEAWANHYYEGVFEALRLIDEGSVSVNDKYVCFQDRNEEVKTGECFEAFFDKEVLFRKIEAEDGSLNLLKQYGIILEINTADIIEEAIEELKSIHNKGNITPPCEIQERITKALEKLKTAMELLKKED